MNEFHSMLAQHTYLFNMLFSQLHRIFSLICTNFLKIFLPPEVVLMILNYSDFSIWKVIPFYGEISCSFGENQSLSPDRPLLRPQKNI